ncbi:hypothetical protein ACWDUL_28790 [Nocardia niigatensis]|uniref:hypothetical protein n=1 Tax=Nocardia niigatensis TaxID=209249 RepID=UPI00030A7551|nr:hypothetical protein [Nocardia niigatensis]
MNLLRLRRRPEPAVSAHEDDRRQAWRLNALSLDYPHPRTRARIDELDAAAPDSTGAPR